MRRKTSLQSCHFAKAADAPEAASRWDTTLARIAVYAKGAS